MYAVEGHGAVLLLRFFECRMEILAVRGKPFWRAASRVTKRYHERRGSDSRTSTRPLAGEGSGGEMGNSRSLLRAQRAIPACKPECALQGRGTVMAFILRGV